MKNVMIILLGVIFLQGCATVYQPSGFGGGYSETQLDENMFKVSFRGNGYTSRERASDFALMRSAELTLNNGYKYFVIIDSGSYSSNSTYTTPTRHTTSGRVNTYGNMAYFNSKTKTRGGQTYNISKPSSSNTIVCFKEKPQVEFSYNAEFTYESISKKYGIR
ncbi:hypothetical protein KKC91_09900 [bacterium]|nr:hypothetical protein [bacterium]